jgi:predicted metal-dependent peptidase
LRLAPARWFSQASGDSFPVLEHLLEGKPRSYGLVYLTEGEGKFPPAARVP